MAVRRGYAAEPSESEGREALGGGGRAEAAAP